MATDPLSLTFGALADPTRRAILLRLAQGEATVQELAEPFDVSLPAISKHLKVLESAQLIERRKDKQWRRCSLRLEQLQAASDCIGQYKEFWEDRFDSLEDYFEKVRKTKSEKGEQRANRRGSRGNKKQK